jgi:CheY-like chemotaxis protein
MTDVTRKRCNTLQHVLIVDDDEATRKVLRFVLEDAGYMVLEAPDGRMALDCLRTHPQRLIVLLDKNMPHVDGVAVLEAVYADPALAKRHCIILVSAYVSRTLPLRLAVLLDALSVEKVDKPFDLDDLFAAMANAEQRCA